jgi:hypothetical protein
MTLYILVCNQTVQNFWCLIRLKFVIPTFNFLYTIICLSCLPFICVFHPFFLLSCWRLSFYLFLCIKCKERFKSQSLWSIFKRHIWVIQVPFNLFAAQIVLRIIKEMCVKPQNMDCWRTPNLRRRGAGDEGGGGGVPIKMKYKSFCMYDRPSSKWIDSVCGHINMRGQCLDGSQPLLILINRSEPNYTGSESGIYQIKYFNTSQPNYTGRESGVNRFKYFNTNKPNYMDKPLWSRPTVSVSNIAEVFTVGVQIVINGY